MIKVLVLNSSSLKYFPFFHSAYSWKKVEKTFLRLIGMCYMKLKSKRMEVLVFKPKLKYNLVRAAWISSYRSSVYSCDILSVVLFFSMLSWLNVGTTSFLIAYLSFFLNPKISQIFLHFWKISFVCSIICF